MKKKVILLPLIMMALASCGGNSSNNSTEPAPSNSTSTSTSTKPSTSTSTKPSTSTSTGGSTVTPTKEYGIVDTPVAGTAYKFGFKQTAKGAMYYMKGEMSGYYIASTTNVAEATDMFVEEAEGGFHLYFMSGTAKKFIQAETSGTHLNAVIKDSATGVWKYKAEWKTLIWSLTDKDVFLGTYGDYVTFGASAVDKAPTSYVSHFYAEGAKGTEPVIEGKKVAVTGVTADESIEVEQGKTKKIVASVLPADATEKGLTFKSNDETKATVDANGVVTGVALGQTTVTVASKENPSFTATVKVTVKEATSVGEVDSIELTIDSLGLQSQKYADGTVEISGNSFQFVELGNYGNGIQMRNKTKASSLWNTVAFTKNIESIEINITDGKAGFSNTDALKFEFAKDAAFTDASTSMLSTVKNTTNYTVTPSAATYTFFRVTINITYSMYFESIIVHFAK